MPGPIVSAVTAAIADGADHLWCARVRGGCAHARHVSTTRPDRLDADLFRAIAATGASQRARLTHCDRGDGTARPMLMFAWGVDFERRSGPRRGAEYRRELLDMLPAAGAGAVLLI